MTFSFARSPFHTGFEALQHVIGHKGLNRSAEAASVDPDGSRSSQQLPAHVQGDRHRLGMGHGGGPDILQQQLGGQPGLIHQGQKVVKVPRFPAKESREYPLSFLFATVYKGLSVDFIDFSVSLWYSRLTPGRMC